MCWSTTKITSGKLWRHFVVLCPHQCGLPVGRHGHCSGVVPEVLLLEIVCKLLSTGRSGVFYPMCMVYMLGGGGIHQNESTIAYIVGKLLNVIY